VSRVFIDFGRNKVYALQEDGEEVMVFNDFLEMFEKLRPTIVVADSYPRKLQATITRLGGAAFLRLRDLKKLSEERKNNGHIKTDENDVKALREMFYKAPDLFQPLYASPVELEVRALTELWVELAGIKRAAKYMRTTTNDPLVVETHKILRRYTERLATRIHERALELPLYRMVVERLGLKGPALAYIISHDGLTLKTMSRERLIFRFQLTGRRRHKKRNMKSRLMIILARSAVFNKHQRYYQVYQRFFERFQTEGYGRKRAFWKAVLRVAERILKDLHTLAKSQTPRSPDT
jgi:hypothetical protein